MYARYCYSLILSSALQNPKTRTEIETLAHEGNEGQLQLLLGKRMVFGTAGQWSGSKDIKYYEIVFVQFWSLCEGGGHEF